MTVQYADLSTVTGQTLTAKVFPEGSDTEVTGNTLVVQERDNDKGTYRVSITRSAVLSGTYKITYFSGDVPFASGLRVFSGTDGEVGKLLEQSIAAGDATLAKQEEILDAIDTYIASVTAVDGSSGTIVGFPATLTVGNSYTTDGDNAIHVFIRDENDDPITSVGTHDFTDPDFSCDLIITNSGNAGRVRATVTYVDPGVAESYLKVEIPLSESSRAAAGAATMQCTLKWDGVAKTIATQTVTWVARI